MQLDINLPQQTPSNDLPNQPQNQMLPDLNDIPTTNIHDRASNTLRRLDNDIVILSHVESIKLLDLLALPIQHTLVNGVRYAVVDELGEYQAVFATVEHLEGVEWER